MTRQTTDSIALRLQHLERAIEGVDYGATSRFAARLGVGFTTWHNAKSGRGLSQKMLLTLVRSIPGVSADWILLGRTEGLSHKMFEILSAGFDKGQDRSRSGSRR